MTKLSDTQRVMLSKAAQHDALLAEPPARLPAAARQSVLRSLIGKGLLEELPTLREHAALGWRQDEDGAWIVLRITAAGLTAIGIQADTETGATKDGEQEDLRRHGAEGARADQRADAGGAGGGQGAWEGAGRRSRASACSGPRFVCSRPGAA